MPQAQTVEFGQWDSSVMLGDFISKLTGVAADSHEQYDFESDWETWVRFLFPGATRAPFADRHRAMWSWAWSIRRDQRPRPLVAVWPRGGAKSSTAELIAICCGARSTRKYVLYVSGTQESADKHVANIAEKLESDQIERWYPALGRRKLTKYGRSSGWRGNRINTDAGFVVDSIGLDSTIRGTKVGDQRPDLICLDDIDSTSDTPASVRKKIETVTQAILPSGSMDCAVLAVQNLIHEDSIFSRLAGVSEHPADFLLDRIVDGPYEAIKDLVIDDRDGVPTIIGGTPTWEGQGIEECQAAIRQYGRLSFMRESQNVFEPPEGGLYAKIKFRHCRPDEIPPLVDIAVWVDPTVTESNQSDSCGIQADGVDENGILYRLWSWERRSSPDYALRTALAKAVELGASVVGVETNQGGDLWEVTYRNLIAELEKGEFAIDGRQVFLKVGDPPTPAIPAIPGIRPGKPGSPGTPGQRPPRFESKRPSGAAESKTERQSRMLVAYEQAKIVHVLGTHEVLERALKRFPVKPMDLADSSYHGWFWLCQALRVMKWA